MGDVRCGDDLILGSPDQQDWSLISGGREGIVLIISDITLFCVNKLLVSITIISQYVV